MSDSEENNAHDLENGHVPPDEEEPYADESSSESGTENAVELIRVSFTFIADREPLGAALGVFDRDLPTTHKVCLRFVCLGAGR